MDVAQYWSAALAQEAETMRHFFRKDAIIRWPNTNEQFTVEEFLRANCEYPGSWAGEVERVEQIGDLIITVVHVYSRDKTVSCHVTSFMRTENDRIVFLDEYWGDDGNPPQWRQEKGLGTAIKRKTAL